VSDFRLDKYEVTVGRFRVFVTTGQGTQLSPPTGGAGARAGIAASAWDESWKGSLASDTGALKAAIKCDPMYQTWTDDPEGNENRPMNCLSWFEAMAFCVWDGGFLPTEAEWNYAATGGDQQLAYPWSNATNSLDPMHASYYEGSDCVGDGMTGCAVTDLVPVGTKPAGDGLWLQSDLAGNVWEWTLDWQAPYSLSCNNCANTAAAEYRIFRGGGFAYGATYLRTGYRGYTTPTYRNSFIGVRCARTL